MMCMSCIGGRHVRCRARDTCACTICRQRHDILASAPPPKATPRPVTEKLMAEVKAEPKAETEPKVATRRPPRFPKPKRARKYAPEVVAEAAAMKFAGVSWTEIGERLNVSSEGIRYAVNRYGDYEKPEGFPETEPVVPEELVVSAKTSISLLETAVASAETTIAQLKAFVEAASDT